MSQETYYPQEVEFAASLSLESNRIPDPYHYYFSSGKLYSPITNQPVENEITIRDTVEEAEYQAFRKIQAWFGEREEGMAVWISPRAPDKGYAASKIIFSDIVYGPAFRKLLRNRAVCFDWDTQKCVLFAKKLGFSEGELRNRPIFLGGESLAAEILYPFAPGQAKLIKEDEDFKIKERLKARIARGYRAPIGPFSLSCGRVSSSAFNLMYADSLNLTDGYFDCPRCSGPIPSGRGITSCPHCGARKEDYSEGCE
jgi:hypothetical protein